MPSTSITCGYSVPLPTTDGAGAAGGAAGATVAGGGSTATGAAGAAGAGRSVVVPAIGSVAFAAVVGVPPSLSTMTLPTVAVRVLTLSASFVTCALRSASAVPRSAGNADTFAATLDVRRCSQMNSAAAMASATMMTTSCGFMAFLLWADYMRQARPVTARDGK